MVSTNYYQEVHVAKQPTDLAPKTVAGATTTPIQDAIDLITDNAAGKRYCVIVHPGTYTEKIILEDYIDLIAAGGREETIIQFTATVADEPTVTGENCMIRGFTIITNSSGATGRCVHNITVGFQMEGCELQITNPDGNEVAFNAAADCEMTECVIDTAGNGNTGVRLSADATTYNIYRCRINSGTIGLLLTPNAITLGIDDTQLSAITDIDGATLVTAHRCYFANVDCDGGSINFYECGIDTIAADGGTIVARGGRVHACTSSTGTSFVWWEDGNTLKVIANMLIGDALGAAAAGDVITVYPGTYAESNLTLVASVNMVGTDAEQCVISTGDAGNAILNAAVDCVISNLTVANTDAGAPAIAVTANTFRAHNCIVNGTGAGDAIAMTGGSFYLYECQIGAGDIDLSTGACALGMYYCRVTTDPIDTAGAFAHTLTFVQCDFNNQNLASAATGATTMSMRGCSNVGQVSNAGSGNFTIRDSDVGDVTTTSTGFITIYGGDVGTCAAVAANGDIVWWKDTNLIYVLPAMLIEHALTDANLASGDTIELGHGTWAESALIAIDGVAIIGQGRDISVIQATDAGNPIIAVGNNVTCNLLSLTIQNLGANNAIDIASVANNSSVTVRDCYIASGADGVTLTTTGAGAPSFEAFMTEFSVTTTAIAVSGGVVADVDLHQCEFTCTNVVTTTGANHTFDAWDSECGGAVTVTANNAVINMTRCNDVGAISNAGTGAMTFEHCTLGNVTNSSTGTVTIENCNCGILAQGAAAGTINAYNSYLTEAQCGAGGAINLYLCDIVDIDADGGTTTVYGGNIRGVSDNTGAIVWWKDENRLYVLASTANMKIADALTATGLAAGDTIEIGHGTFAESNLTAVNGVDIIGEGLDTSIIEATDNANPIITVGTGVTCVFSGVKISNLGTTSAIDISAGAGAASLTVRDCTLKSDAANSIVTVTTTAAGAPTFIAYSSIFDTGADAITVTGAVVATVTVSQSVFTACTLAFSTTGANHAFTFDDCDLSTAGITLSANVPVVSLTKCNEIGTFTHNTASTVTLRDCYVSGTYTIGAVVGVVNAFRTQLSTFTNGGSGAIAFAECNGTDINNNSTSTMTIEGGHWDTVLQAAAAGTINIYGAVIATELDCSAAGAINAHNCYVADVDGNGGTITIYSGELLAVTDSTGTVLWNTGPTKYEVITGMNIQDALTAGAGGEVLIHAGAYAPTANLTVSADTLVRGEGFGTVITATGAAITNAFVLNGNDIHLKDMKIVLVAGCGTGGARPNVIYASAQSFLWLENLWLVGDTSVADDGSVIRQCGVCFINVDESKILGCRSEDNKRYGISLNTGSDSNTISGNTCQGNSQEGIFLDSCLHNTITNNTCQGNVDCGIYISSSTDNTLAGNTCQGNTVHGIFLDWLDTGNTMTGNTCQGNGQTGIRIEGGSNYNTITGNSCNGNTASSGIYIDGSTNNTLTGNTCQGNGASGIGVSASSETVVTGNTCQGNTTHGIYIIRSSYCAVTGNGCYDNGTDGINVTGDGTTNADYNSLTGNTCTGNGSNGIEVVGGLDANENIVVANNLKNNTAAGFANGGNLTEQAHNVV